MSPLGKKVPPPPAPPKEDVIERTDSGLWRVNGKLQTNKPEPKHLPEPPKPPEPLPQPTVIDFYLYGPLSTEQWDLLRRGIQDQINGGYPLNEFGVM